jgi:dihydrofolate reductase
VSDAQADRIDPRIARRRDRVTSRLDDLLLRERLVDELHLWYVPVVVGAGQRLFEGVDTSSLDLRLMDERRLGNGNGSLMLSYAVG